VPRALRLLLALVAVSGCGGSSNGQALTRDQYATKADAICGKYKRQTEALGRIATPAELASAADKVLSVLRRARGELRDLEPPANEPPANERATANAWLAQFDVIIDDVEKIRDKAKANDVEGVRALAQPALQHNARANELATRLGMTVCNKD
jgi:hypothetical protein